MPTQNGKWKRDVERQQGDRRIPLLSAKQSLTSDEQTQKEVPPCPHCGTSTKLGAVIFRMQSGQPLQRPLCVFGCGKCAKVVRQVEVEFRSVNVSLFAR